MFQKSPVHPWWRVKGFFFMSVKMMMRATTPRVGYASAANSLFVSPDAGSVLIQDLR
jgi:hypothetical protein